MANSDSKYIYSSNLSREAFTDADNFGISFPLDLDVKVNIAFDHDFWLSLFIELEVKVNS